MWCAALGTEGEGGSVKAREHIYILILPSTKFSTQEVD